MIVRTLKDAEAVDIFEGAQSYCLVAKEDGMGHSLYDLTISAGEEAVVSPEYLSGYESHAYYCLEGVGICLVDGKEYPMDPGALVTATSTSDVILKAETVFCFAVVFCSEDAKSVVISRHLEDVVGSNRDVKWGNGQSRRLLIDSDGLGFAFCVTQVNPNTNSFIQYKNHYESCYYIQGTGEYKWATGSHPINTNIDQGTVFIMNEHDTHTMCIEDESICLSIFTPAIEGNEKHKFSSDSASSY